MAGLIDEATNRLIAIAGKSDTYDNKSIVRAEIEGTIEQLNVEFNWAVLEADDTVTFSGGSTNHTVTMPVDFGKMRKDGFGEYDSTNDRMKRVWNFKTEDWFHRNYSGVMTYLTSTAGQGRIWFFVPDTSAGLKQVRVYPSPSSSLTAMVRYYEKLTPSNIGRLRDATILVDGTMWRLPRWFSEVEWQVAKMRYDKAVVAMKAARRSAMSGMDPAKHPTIRRANTEGWSLR